MEIKIRRWQIDRKADRYIQPEEKIILGKNARDVMSTYNALVDTADLFAHTKWEIINIWD